MSMREKVARAIYDNEGEALGRDADSDEHWLNYTDLADTAITAFLEAAAEQNWRMVRDEPTEEMIKAAGKVGYHADHSDYMDAIICAANSAAPKFKWDK